MEGNTKICEVHGEVIEGRMYKIIFLSEYHIEKQVINSDTKQIILNNNDFGIQKSIRLFVEQGENQWFILSDSAKLALWEEHKQIDTICIEDNVIFTIESGKNDERIVGIVTQDNGMICPAEKIGLGTIQTITVGREKDADIIIDHPTISSVHCVFEKMGENWFLIDKSLNGTYVNGEVVYGKTKLNGGEIVNLVAFDLIFTYNFIFIIPVIKESFKISNFILQGKDIKHKESEKDGLHYFHRSPRNVKFPKMETISIDNPTSKQEIEKKPLIMLIGPSFTMVLPMILGSVLAIYSYKTSGTSSGIMIYAGIITAISSAIIGVLWTIISLRYEKNRLLIGENDRQVAYSKYLQGCIYKIQSASEEVRQAMIQMYKSPADCILEGQDSTGLWNRNILQEDFLVERVGLGEVDVSEYILINKERFDVKTDDLLKLPKQIKQEYAVIDDIPRCIDLGKEGIVGLVGENSMEKAFDLARVILCQLFANNCYTEVKVALAFDREKDGDEWAAYRFVPHIWSNDYKRRFLASNKNEIDEMFYELIDILKEREQAEVEEKKNIHIVLFVTDTKILEEHALGNYISGDAKKYDFTVVTLATKVEELLNQTDKILLNSKAYMGIKSLLSGECQEVLFDKVGKQQMISYVNLLSDIKVKDEGENSGVPDTLTFFEMLGVNTLEELNALKRWETCKTYMSLRASIGRTAGGKDCILDVHEKFHGPHGLVAGTTGSGKSETLQTYLLSLAVNYSPDDLGFFIIDYKGGGMANLFEGLPHMMGSISNLSGSEITRAMVSIKSEIQRRQVAFNYAGVNNINDYTKLVKSGENFEPIPHLFIIVDEFAELKREQGVFMQELVSVAQVGRSLGVHLILSTQKPAGTVDENIWSNTKFKLCLRVQDRQDSREMLHKDDAAYITNTGRGYLQVGNDEVYELFQSGWSGAEYIVAEKKTEEAGVAELTASGTGIKRKRRKTQFLNITERTTQFEAVRDYLAELAKNNGYNRQYNLWISPLENPLYLESVPNIRVNSEKNGLEVTIGMYDDPEKQIQAPFVIDLVKAGTLAVLGTNVSGKSTLLQTLTYSLMTNYTPEDVNIYIADFSNRSLFCFEDAPYVGGVVCEEDAEGISKLIYLINKIISERKNIMRGVNFETYRQEKGSDIPAIVFIIDNLNAFRELTEFKYDDDIIRFMHDGVTYGVYTILSANGFGTNGIPSKMEDNINECIALQMNERYMYATVLRCGKTEIEPEPLKGRGLAKIDNKILEFQTALPVANENEMGRMELIREQCRHLRQQNPYKVARRIPIIPEKPLWGDFKEKKEVVEMAENTRFVPIGYDQNSAEIYGVDLRFTYCFMVSGAKRSGKKNFLKNFIQATAMRKASNVIIDFSDSEFKAVAKMTGSTYISNEAKMVAFFSDLVQEFSLRNKQKNIYRDQGMDEEQIYEKMREFEELFICISDINRFVDMVYQPSEGMVLVSPFLENIAEKGSLHNIYLVALNDTQEASMCRGNRFYDAMVSYHTGIQLGGNTTDSDFFDFSRLSYAEQNRINKCGVGMIPQDNDERDITYVIIPQYKG